MPQVHIMTTRLVSAGIGIIIALTVLFLHQTILFPIAVGIVSVILMLEFFKVNHLLKYRIATGSAMLFALLYPFVLVGEASRFKFLLVILCIIGVCIEYILRQTKLWMRSFFGIMTGMFLIPGAMSTTVYLNNCHEQHGVIYVVFALAGAWIADSGAYFAGSALGKHKLCPTISPKKTVEGLVGGVIADVLFFSLFNIIYTAILAAQGMDIHFSWGSTLIVAVACALLGTVGDLTASVLKRQLEIKDYGTIMPGHGGLLDRFDSVLLVAPFLYAYITAFGFFTV
ncbi:MAG: phosphatidate cytidylyltransferase [Oscillospiraceae bacterium]|nr:phosphatidate cytidylyltransferase [Oscillospiraceae bacterium]